MHLMVDRRKERGSKNFETSCVKPHMVRAWPCMLYGNWDWVSEENDALDEDIVASHILPSSTAVEIAAFCEMSLGDIQKPKILTFL